MGMAGIMSPGVGRLTFGDGRVAHGEWQAGVRERGEPSAPKKWANKKVRAALRMVRGRTEA